MNRSFLASFHTRTVHIATAFKWEYDIQYSTVHMYLRCISECSTLYVVMGWEMCVCVP